MKSGRGPISARNQRERDERAGAERNRQRPSERLVQSLRVGRERGDEVFGLHAFDRLQTSASDFSARCSATRTATSVIASRSAVAEIDCPSSEIDFTMSFARGAERLHQAFDVGALVRIFLGRRRQHRLKILDRLVTAHAAPAQGVDDLVARDRIDPRGQFRAAVPGLALQMDRQQRLLHDILDIRIAQPSA